MQRYFTLIAALFIIRLYSSWQVSGYVLDSTAMGLDQVLIKSGRDYTLSGSDGSYRIRVAENDTILFHKLGYADKKYSLEKLPVQVKLKKSVINLAGKDIREDKRAGLISEKRLKISRSENLVQQNAAEYLQSEGGLILEGSRLEGTNQSLRVPGYDSRHTLVMLDGIVLNQPGEEFDLSQIPMSLISEIEFLTGSAEVGSGGMGTVINFKTREIEQGEELEAELGYGSFDYRSVEVRYQDILGRFRYQSYMSYQAAENDFEYPTPEIWQDSTKTQRRENNSFDQLDISGFAGYYHRGTQADIKLYYTDFMRMLPGAVNNPELYYKARMTGNTLKLQANFEQNSPRLQFRLRCWYHREKTIYDNTRLNEPYNQFLIYYIYGSNDQEIEGVKPEVEWLASRIFRIKLGGECVKESYEYKEDTMPSNSIDKTQREKQAVYSEINLNKEWSQLSLWQRSVIRHDRAETFEEETSGSVSGGVDYDNGFLLRSSIGRFWSYTLPSFYSLYWKGDSQTMGNPQLLPERSESWQAGIMAEYEGSNFSVNWRSDKIRERIIWIQTFNGAWKPMNIGRAEVLNLEYGIFLELGWGLSIRGVYNRSLTADKTRLENGEPSAYYDKELIYTPDYQGNVSISWKMQDFRIKAESELTGSQWTTRDQLSSEKQLDSYELYNLILGYSHNVGDLEVNWNIEAKNLLDLDYNVYAYMPQPGRNYKLNLNIRW